MKGFGYYNCEMDRLSTSTSFARPNSLEWSSVTPSTTFNRSYVLANFCAGPIVSHPLFASDWEQSARWNHMGSMQTIMVMRNREGLSINAECDPIATRSLFQLNARDSNLCEKMSDLPSAGFG